MGAENVTVSSRGKECELWRTQQRPTSRAAKLGCESVSPQPAQPHRVGSPCRLMLTRRLEMSRNAAGGKRGTEKTFCLSFCFTEHGEGAPFSSLVPFRARWTTRI